MNKPSFDVSKEPCIPVIRNGELEYVSLRDALVNAHEYLEIQNPLLTVEFGLYRLLIALMGDIFFVEQEKSLNTVHLSELLKKGKFDATRIDEYFAKYAGAEENRFDLFSETHPFLQVTGLNSEKIPIAVLLHSLPSGTNVTHFHHGSENDFAASPSKAFQLLTTIAPFMTAGGSGKSPSINGAPPIYLLIHGVNVFETLCLNFCVVPWDIEPDSDDKPSWRSDRVIGGEKTRSGYLESLTWMPRRIQLVPTFVDSPESNRLMVHTMKFIAGDSTRFEWRDPSCAYRLSDKGATVLRVREGRSLWRDISPLILLEKKTRIAQRPRLIDQLKLLGKNEDINLSIYGLRTDNAKVFEWYRDHFSVPVRLNMREELLDEVYKRLELAEKAADDLRIAIKKLYPRDGKGNKKAFDTLIQYAERRFWERLRLVFEVTLSGIKAEEKLALQRRLTIRNTWKQQVSKEAKNSLEQVISYIENKSRSLERASIAMRYLSIRLAGSQSLGRPKATLVLPADFDGFSDSIKKEISKLQKIAKSNYEKMREAIQKLIENQEQNIDFEDRQIALERTCWEVLDKEFNTIIVELRHQDDANLRTKAEADWSVLVRERILLNFDQLSDGFDLNLISIVRQKLEVDLTKNVKKEA